MNEDKFNIIGSILSFLGVVVICVSVLFCVYIYQYFGYKKNQSSCSLEAEKYKQLYEDLNSSYNDLYYELYIKDN